MRQMIESGKELTPMVVAITTLEKDDAPIRPIFMLDFKNEIEKHKSVDRTRTVLQALKMGERLLMFLFVADAHMRILKVPDGRSQDEVYQEFMREREKGARIEHYFDSQECLVCNGFGADGERIFINQSYLRVGKGKDFEIIWGNREEAGTGTQAFESNLWDGIF